jgi:hypothetical protein
MSKIILIYTLESLSKSSDFVTCKIPPIPDGLCSYYIERVKIKDSSNISVYVDESCVEASSGNTVNVKIEQYKEMLVLADLKNKGTADIIIQYRSHKF